MGLQGTGSFGKEMLLEIPTRLLDSHADLGFLLQLDERCLEQLIVAVRVRFEKTT
jgi:hypothetical protein